MPRLAFGTTHVWTVQCAHINFKRYRYSRESERVERCVSERDRIANRI